MYYFFKTNLILLLQTAFYDSFIGLVFFKTAVLRKINKPNPLDISKNIIANHIP